MGLRKHPEHVRCAIVPPPFSRHSSSRRYCSYSNLDNHPNLLREAPAAARIRLGKKVARHHRSCLLLLPPPLTLPARAGYARRGCS